MASSVGRIPDDGQHIVIVLPGRATEIGVELLATECRVGEAEGHILFARILAFLDPARTDFDIMQCTA